MTEIFLSVTDGRLVAALISRFLSAAAGGSRAVHLRPSSRFCALAFCAMFLWSDANAQEEDEGANTFACDVEELNEGLPPNEAPLRLDSVQPVRLHHGDHPLRRWRHVALSVLSRRGVIR